MARGLSGYVDALADHRIQNYLKEIMPIDVEFLGDYPDWFAFLMILLLAVILAFGAKESSILNNIFTTVNILTIVIVIVAGSLKG